MVIKTQAQTIAYDAEYSGYSVYECIDLYLLNPIVKGHQMNVDIDYFTSIIDADNNINPVPRFYSYNSTSEILYARVTNNLNLNYDTSVITLNLIPVPCCPPPPSGINSYSFCDVDNDNTETVYLDNLITYPYIGIPMNSFCGLTNDQVVTTYYLSEDDANNEVDPIGSVYELQGTVEVFFRIENTVNTSFFISQMGISLITCPDSDTDGDGIQDSNEDVNRNGSFIDDDTDNDGLKNYEDDDDDNDNVLTINEDANNNGDPTDDDLDSSGIPDYLEANVTLSNEISESNDFKIYPNPFSEIIYVNISGIVFGGKVLLFDINGKILFSKEVFSQNLRIDTSDIKSGVYFLNIKTPSKTHSKKIIKL
ncbi:MAG: hypothetical protein Tsb0033_26800 [Winogradskyella sp.]